QVGVGEALHHLGAEAVLVVQHVVRDTEPVGDLAGILDVLAGAAGTRLADRDAMVVKLQGDADHVVTLPGQQRRRDRRIDAARHRDHHTGVAGRLVEPQGVTGGIAGHGGAYIGPDAGPNQPAGLVVATAAGVADGAGDAFVVVDDDHPVAHLHIA